MRALVPAAAALVTALLAPAQQVAPTPTEHGAIVANKDGLVLPAREFSVAELIEATATFLCRNYLYDPSLAARTGSFALQKQLALDAFGAEEMLAALLAARGLTALPLDEPRGVWQVLPLEDPRVLTLLPWRAPDAILRRPRLRELAVTAIDLQHTDARAMAQLLRQHGQHGTATPPPFFAFATDARVLLLRGYRDQIAAVLHLVHELEQAAAPPPRVAEDELQQRVEDLERELAELKALLAARRPHAGR